MECFNRKVIDKEFVKIQIARKTAENKTCIHNFLLLASLQCTNEYGEMYDRRYPITIVMPNNGEKENNMIK